MLSKLARLVRPGAEASPPPSIPDGRRVYAIGDVHGRLDLLRELARAIEADDAQQEPAQTTVILLGDLIDRGPDSAGVIAFVRNWKERRDVRVLMANHEQMLLRALESKEVLREYMRYGGREMLLSYGVDRDDYDAATNDELLAMLPQVLPEADLDFIRGFEDWIAIGDYLFVHAGIRPGVPIEEQSGREFYWIREPFLSHRKPHSHMVVHGHTITDRVEIRSNRIGIDTGAYGSGRLTAVALEKTDRRFVAAVEDAVDGTIAIEHNETEMA
ncbi:metallophosphoesterase family protein [Qipengyuania sp. MTN3-11]|uniref:metallophosphoesterase family protein n=1 Tax=Qipengyuania sp. MTN3-11 TaxID=3056557 RepID=UPI0036F3DF36